MRNPATKILCHHYESQYCYPQLYWDLQLLNAGNLNTFNGTDEPLIIDPHVLDCLHHSTDPNTYKKVVGKKELFGSVRGVKRIKKAARQCWAR